MRSHLLLSWVAHIAIWMHVRNFERPMGTVLLGSLVFRISLTGLRICWIICRNTRVHALGRLAFSKAEAHKLHDSTYTTLSIILPRKWTIRPGQYVYIWIPRLSLLQAHPFQICWWERVSDEKLKLSLLVEHRGSWTHRLHQQFNNVAFRQRSTSDGDKHPMQDGVKLGFAIASGPRGAEDRLRHHGTIVAFATDIGIAALLPYIKHLVEGARRYSVCTRCIVLFWTINNPCKSAEALKFCLLTKSQLTHMLFERGFPSYCNRITDM